MSMEHKIRTTKRLEKSKQHRDAFVRAHIKEGLCFQIRALRKQRGWTQKILGKKARFSQSKISDFENPNYPNELALDTLKRLASAFEVALIVRFGSFGELIEWASELRPGALEVPSFTDDSQCAGWLQASAGIARADKVSIPLAVESTPENPLIQEDVGMPIQFDVKFDTSQRGVYAST